MPSIKPCQAASAFALQNPA